MVLDYGGSSQNKQQQLDSSNSSRSCGSLVTVANRWHRVVPYQTICSVLLLMQYLIL